MSSMQSSTAYAEMVEALIPTIDKWIADTSDKLNALAETVRSMQGGTNDINN